MINSSYSCERYEKTAEKQLSCFRELRGNETLFGKGRSSECRCFICLVLFILRENSPQTCRSLSRAGSTKPLRLESSPAGYGTSGYAPGLKVFSFLWWFSNLPREVYLDMLPVFLAILCRVVFELDLIPVELPRPRVVFHMIVLWQLQLDPVQQHLMGKD